MKLLKDKNGGVVMEYVAITLIIGTVYMSVFFGIRQTVNNMFLAKQTYDEQISNDNYCEYTKNHFDEATKTIVEYEWNGSYSTSGIPTCQLKN